MNGHERFPGLEFEDLHGAEIESRLDGLARVRMAVFREWPYLYEGDEAYERQYLGYYIRSPRALVHAVLDGGEVVGMTSALPLDDESELLQAPFTAAGIDPAHVFYYGEAILLPAYRGRGLYRHFFERRDAHARSFGRYDLVSFCGVMRPDDHPLRPADALPLDPVWRHFGFTPRDDLIARYPWRDVGDNEETEKTLKFWIKPLS